MFTSLCLIHHVYYICALDIYSLLFIYLFNYLCTSTEFYRKVLTQFLFVLLSIKSAICYIFSNIYIGVYMYIYALKFKVSIHRFIQFCSYSLTSIHASKWNLYLHVFFSIILNLHAD